MINQLRMCLPGIIMALIVPMANGQQKEQSWLSKEKRDAIVKQVAEVVGCSSSDISVVNAKGGICFQYKVRDFHVHGYTSLHGWKKKPRIEKGPSHKGIDLLVKYRSGKYFQKKVLPQTYSMTYWKVRADKRNVNENRNHYLVAAGYGTKISDKKMMGFVKTIMDILVKK